MTSSRLASSRSRSTSMPPKKAASTMTARAIPQSTRCEPPSARVMTDIIAREGDDEIARAGIRSRERLAAPMLVVGELEAGRHRAAEQRPFPSGHQPRALPDSRGHHHLRHHAGDQILSKGRALFRMPPKAQPLDDLLRGQHSTPPPGVLRRRPGCAAVYSVTTRALRIELRTLTGSRGHSSFPEHEVSLLRLPAPDLRGFPS